MKTIYYYLRNIIKYGKGSEHVIYNKVSNDFVILKYNHLNCLVSFNISDYHPTFTYRVDPARIIETLYGDNIEYLGEL